MTKERWFCIFCGRDKFTKKYQPHRCRDGFTKNWKKMEKLKGLKPGTSFIQLE